MKNVLRIVFHRPLLEKEGNLAAELLIIEIKDIEWAMSNEFIYLGS